MVALVPLASAVDFPSLPLQHVLTPSLFPFISSPHFSPLAALPRWSSRARRPRLLVSALQIYRHGQITPQSSTEGHLARPAPFRSTRPICW